MTIDKETLQSLFEAEYMTTKEDLVQAIEKLGDYWENEDDEHNEEYKKCVLRLLGEFREAVDNRKLFDHLKDLWGYSISVRGGGIYLYLEHYHWKQRIFIPDKVSFEKDESYELFVSKARLINAEEYAVLHGISHPAAVSRIRRGKIRCAVKVGVQWRIPELAEPITKGYQSAEYSWKGMLTGVNEKYRIIEDYSHAEFFQDADNLILFHIRFTGENVEPMEFTCTREQRGAIEQILIAHPDVDCLSDYICRVIKKYEVETMEKE